MDLDRGLSLGSERSWWLELDLDRDLPAPDDREWDLEWDLDLDRDFDLDLDRDVDLDLDLEFEGVLGLEDEDGRVGEFLDRVLEDLERLGSVGLGGRPICLSWLALVGLSSFAVFSVLLLVPLSSSLFALSSPSFLTLLWSSSSSSSSLSLSF